jgi:flagellar basal body P-ring protein FlgI
MNRRVWVLGAVLLGLMGCSHTPTLPRLQSEDEADRKPEIKTIGDVTSVANADPIPVSGVGLVVGLQGTGGTAPPGGYTKMLEDQLAKQKVKNVKELLASPNNSLVLVSGLIPAGARKGDSFDIEITLPQGSRTTSLRGGELIECCLYNYDSTKHLDPSNEGPDRPVIGHVLAKAKGDLLVGFGDGDDESSKQRQGRIWGGAKCEASRPFYLALNSDQQYARLAMRIAERVNETFQGSGKSAPGTEIAVAKTKEVVVLGVPSQYHYNLVRYLRVVRMIPLQELPPPSSPYRRHLEEDLLDPARTVTAALRLEALGTDTIPVLKRGLKSEHVLVRFTSAEALAYLGSPACGEELAQLVEQQPALRAFCLTAMASLDEAVCHVKLRELLSSPSAETRYGAFRALRVLDENDAFIQGELLNDAFWLHRVSPNSTSLVHMSSSHRPEIVLFGEDAYLEPPFSFMAGAEFTVTASRDDDKCMVSRFSLKHGTQRRQCSLKLEDVLHAVADMGGTYPDVTELLRQAGNCRALTCRVAVDELPQATSIFELARAGAKKVDGHKLDEEILNARLDFGTTPNLFEAGVGRKRRSSDDADAELLQDTRKPRDDKRSSAQRKSASDD